VILGLGQDKAVDYWALGILMYELLVGYTPFHADSYKETYQKILKSSVVYPKKLTSSAVDLLEKFLGQYKDSFDQSSQLTKEELDQFEDF
jgi:serine/threonine protein kinase